jgi:hypothetical protein
MRSDIPKCVVTTHLLRATVVVLGIVASGQVLHAEMAGPEDANHSSCATRLQEAVQRMDEMAPAIPQIRERLDLLLKRCKSLSDPNGPGRFTTLQQQCAAMSNKIRDLEKEIEKLKAALKTKNEDPASGKLKNLQRMLKETEDRWDQLAAEAARLRDKLRDGQEGRGQGIFEFAPEMLPEYAMITKNRIVPVKSPYYETRDLLTNRGSIREYKRVLDGENAEDAIKPGGCLDVMLSEIDPSKEYVKFLVCSDSVQAFRVATKAVKKRGISIAWEPGKDQTLYGVQSGPGGPGDPVNPPGR